MDSYPKNISASLENSRNCLRRIARNDDTEFSHQSVLNLIEKFVKTVNTMDETILVPCRLMDLKVGDDQDPARPEKKGKGKTQSLHPAQELLNAADLFEVYNLLNGMKAGLVWGHGSGSEEADTQGSKVGKDAHTGPVKTHVRRSSTVSVASTSSTSSSLAMSDSESDASTEADSGIEEPGEEFTPRTELVAQHFRKHLAGLTRSLRQMTEVAQYLTERYQLDIGGGSV